MVQEEYEVIAHNSSNFHIFLVNLLYRTPHIHKDFEISLVIDGVLSLITPAGEHILSSGDIFVMNPFLSHELKASSPVLILSLQVSSAFFSSYYPLVEQAEFDSFLIRPSEKSSSGKIRGFLFAIALAYYQKEDYFPLKCAAVINQLFLCLFSTENYHLIPEKERQAALTKGKRIRRILQYIENHYTEKILLSDIAEQENLDLYYLSHFFKECFGISFQEYVTRLRCEKARQLLLLTDYSLLDICLNCGFSDPKYFKKGFQSQYGCTPKSYRSNFKNARLEQQQKSMLTTQEFLSETASLIILNKYAGH